MRHLAPVASAAALLFGSYVAHAQPAPGASPTPSASVAPLPQPPPPPPAGATTAAPPPAGATTAAPPPAAPPPVSSSPAPRATAPGIPPHTWERPGYPMYPSADTPDELPYEEGAFVPPGYHVESRTRRGAVIAGGVMTGVGYLLAAGLAATSLDKSSDGELLPLFIPFIGPFITVGSLDWSGDFGGLAFAVIGIPLILDGLVQTTGGILLAVGLTSPKKSLVRDGAYTADTSPRLRLGPKGVAIEGRF